MDFKHIQLEDILKTLDKLEPNTQPKWGTMSAQRMVEHLTDTLDLAIENVENVQLEIPEEKVTKAQAFIGSEHPMPRNFEATFAPSDKALRNESIDLAIDEFAVKWIDFENYFESNPDQKTLHPNFGELDFKLWKELNAKHLKHHFEQFGLV